MKLKKYIPHLLLFICAMIWGFAFVAQDLVEGIGASTVIFARNWIAAVFLIFAVMIFDKINGGARKLFSRRGIDITRTELIGGAICGICLGVASLFQQMGIQSGTDGGKAAFITSLYVVMVPIYSLFIKKRPPFTVWISVAIAAVGFYLLCIKESVGISPSDTFVVIAALLFPFHILVIDYFSPRCDGIRLSLVQFITCGIIMTPFSLIMDGGISFEAIGKNILPIVFLGIFSSGIAYTLQILGQNGPDPSVASIIMSLESVFGVIGTALVLGSRLELREYIGCAIVFGAVVLAQLDFRPKSRKKESNVGDPDTEPKPEKNITNN